MKPIWIVVIIIVVGIVIVWIIAAAKMPKGEGSTSKSPCPEGKTSTSSLEYKVAYDKLSPQGQMMMPSPGTGICINLAK